MYEAYYHLRSKPFQLSPDPAFFFSSRGHKRALAYLVYGVHQGEGFIVITGEIGAGKTTLAQALVRKVASENVTVAQVVTTSLAADDLLRMVAAAFGLPNEGHKANLLKQIEQFLLVCHKRKKRALLIVDEAQNLPVGSLEELRMLSNFTHADKPLLQTFLLGQPEFRAALQDPGMEQLRQRVIASCHLGVLDRDETEGYIFHRLRIVGWSGDPSFKADALDAIHRHTGGIPRKINLFCDRLLLMGRFDEKHEFGGHDVSQVMNELKEEFAFAEPKA